MGRLPSKVSVVIAALDVVDVIDVQLTALAEQTYQGDYEVIVSDNGSSDGLREHIESHRLSSRIQLRWVDASGARGVSHARNVGVGSATGDFIAFCDADDRVHQSWLSFLTGSAADYDAVGGGLDGVTLSTARAVAWRPLPHIDVQPSATNARYPWVGGGNMGIWRSTFDEIGGWDETYGHALEDMELCWRLQLQGRTLGWQPKAIVHYRLRDGLRDLCRQAENYGRGEVRLYHDYRGRCIDSRPVWLLAGFVGALVVRNPLLPTFVTRLPRGQWLWHFYGLVGRIRGWVQYRVIYI